VRRSGAKKRRADGGIPSLFVGTTEQWWLNASLNWMPTSYQTLDAYAEGYLQAAQHLSRAVLRRRTRLTLDYVAIPIVFLWRHYIEIRLKELIIASGALLGKRQKHAKTHDLVNLWGQARPLLKNAAQVSDRELKRADTIIKQFANVDPSSEHFRYAEDSNGNRSLGGVRQINLGALTSEMIKLSALFEGASIMISVYLQQEADTRDDY
jgi:hypothetical protein